MATPGYIGRLLLGVCVFMQCSCAYQPEPSRIAETSSPKVNAALPYTKWNPGHYVLAPLRITDQNLRKMLDEISGVKTFRGMQKRYTWTSLEPMKDHYDFSEIKRDLQMLASRNLRLVVQIQYKSFHGNDNYAPAYLQGGEYGGGVFRLSGGGHNLVLWNDAVLGRLKRLYVKMGEELDAMHNLEAIVVPESAPGRKPDMGPTYDEARYVENLVAAAKTLKKAFPTTVVIQYANYPASRLGKMIDELVADGIGIGGPDTFPYRDAEFLHQGIYTHYPPLAGVVPLAIAVQDDNYTSKKPQGVYDPTSARDIYLFARDKLRVNYIFWLWKKRPVDYFSEVRKMMNRDDFLGDDVGGLASDYPLCNRYIKVRPASLLNPKPDLQ